MIKKKICMVGLFGTGKTSLVKRFVESTFGERYLTTVGVKIDRKDVVVDGREVTLAIWDLAGHDMLAGLRISNIRGASGYLLVADGCRGASLEKAIDLQRQITEVLGDLPFLLLINKSDLRDEWEVSAQAVGALGARGWQALETSAKTGDGVEQAFQTLTREILAKTPFGAGTGDEE